MKRYSLLRNNMESGPFTLSELKRIGLAKTDLIWIENESMAWTYPTSIEELTSIANKGIKVSLDSEKVKHSAEAENVTASFISTSSAIQYRIETTEKTEDYSSYLIEREKPIEWKPKRQKRSLTEITTGFFGLGILLIGVMMCAFVVKKLVEQFDIEQPLFSAEAVEIQRETLALSSDASMAKATTIATASTLPIVASEQAPVEVITSSITNETTTKTADKPLQPTPVTVAKMETENIISAASLTTETSDETPAEIKEEKPSEKPAKKASLNLSANDYKVGVFGGISEFELAVANPSSVGVDKAVVEIEYLKPNGNVVKSQTLSVENIAAGGAKTIQVPASSRGVKLRYRVVSIEAAE